MGNIIEFPVPEGSHVEFEEDESTSGMIVMDAEMKLRAGFESDDQDLVFLGVNGQGVEMSRERLAQWLWAAVHLIDGEARYQATTYEVRDYD